VTDVTCDCFITYFITVFANIQHCVNRDKVVEKMDLKYITKKVLMQYYGNDHETFAKVRSSFAYAACVYMLIVLRLYAF
jgi:hypothetical protein